MVAIKSVTPRLFSEAADEYERERGNGNCGEKARAGGVAGIGAILEGSQRASPAHSALPQLPEILVPAESTLPTLPVGRYRLGNRQRPRQDLQFRGLPSGLSSGFRQRGALCGGYRGTRGRYANVDEYRGRTNRSDPLQHAGRSRVRRRVERGGGPEVHAAIKVGGEEHASLQSWLALHPHWRGGWPDVHTVDGASARADSGRILPGPDRYADHRVGRWSRIRRLWPLAGAPHHPPYPRPTPHRRAEHAGGWWHQGGEPSRINRGAGRLADLGYLQHDAALPA